MAKQCEFLVKQQALAYHVARLPLLRDDVLKAEEDAGKGEIPQWRLGEIRFAYNQCVAAVKQLAAAL